MALINYVEPVNAGSLFVGIGSLICAGVLAYIIYRLGIRLCGLIDVLYNKEAKYEIFQEVYLDRLAAKDGIDLNKELLKKNMISKEPIKIRRRIEERIFEDMFPENKTKKKE